MEFLLTIILAILAFWYGYLNGYTKANDNDEPKANYWKGDENEK